LLLALAKGFFFVNFIVIIIIIMKLRRKSYMISVTEISEKLQISKIMVYRFIKDNEIKHSAKVEVNLLTLLTFLS